MLDLIAPPLYGGRRLVRTAQVIINPTKIDTVALGNTVTFGRDNGRVQTYRIVGEDEADPKADLFLRIIGAGEGIEPLYSAWKGFRATED